MYYINEQLIRNISSLHDMSQRAFSTFVFGSDQFYPHRLCRFHLFIVNDIVQMANATHIPIRHFFCDNKDGELPTSLDEIKVQGEWKDITINLDQLQRISLGKGYGFSRRELLGFLNVDVSIFWRWVHTSFKMHAQMLCDMCNEFGINLSDIIVDPNAAIPPATPTRYTAKAKEKQPSNARVKQKERKELNGQEEANGVNRQSQPDINWQWQQELWPDSSVPTLTEFIGYCNRHHRTTLPFLTNLNSGTASDAVGNSANATEAAEDAMSSASVISLDNKAYTMVMKSLGITETPDTIFIDKFCSIVQNNALTPACCINDASSHYPTTFPDRMARALGSAGIVVC